MTNEEIYKAYMQRYSYLPISKDKVEKFLCEHPLLRSCEDMKYLTNLMADWVGSNQEFEEGAEMSW